MPEFWKFTGWDTPIYINKDLLIAAINSESAQFENTGKLTQTTLSVIAGDSIVRYGVRESLEEVLRILSSTPEIPTETESKYKDYREFRENNGMVKLIPQSWDADQLNESNDGRSSIVFYDPDAKRHFSMLIDLPIEEVKRIVGWKGE